MADNLDLAIRIRADLKSAIDGLSQMEAELQDVGAAAGGSSPLARGTRKAGRRCPTPAAVHPRSRGEHCFVGVGKLIAAGSSPLARGTLGTPSASSRPGRFIPARAGNTWVMPMWPSSATVHPRSRGEHPLPSTSSPCSTGSSPLARGTPAGRVARLGRGPVHPRSRGEHLFATSRKDSEIGFIPARAGNTAPSSGSRCRRSVHPRSRGEHRRVASRAWDAAGSSPLARGTPKMIVGSTLRDRFIPARAGNTVIGSPGATARPVHPRSRGEHDGLNRPAPLEPGSSPLARGTPRRSCGR